MAGYQLLLISGERTVSAGTAALLAVVFLGVGASAIGFSAWAYALKATHASRVVSVLYLVPGFAILVGWLWLGELPAPATYIGGVVALGGVILTNTRGRATAVNAREQPFPGAVTCEGRG